ncbi:MAG: hypothetical protein CMJ25_19030 [Phycisphaerae bacterium]|nr:hypothetical protein [Phycisphaerae bacterium]|tara:strand:- start:503 stop:733 length:231 start_codon:yes stop_codon:yes gene_type:complete
MALSKTQTKRLGGILTLMFGDDIPSDLLTTLITDGYIKVNGQKYDLTEKGLDEKNRLCTLAGLNIMYSSEKKETLK